MRPLRNTLPKRRRPDTHSQINHGHQAMKWIEQLSAQSRFVRRVWLVHLAFSLAGAVALFIAIAWVTESYQGKAFVSDCLAALSKAESQVAVARLVDQGRLQTIVDEWSKAHGAVECAVVDVDGTYLAHSDPKQVGVVHREPEGKRARHDGAVESVRFKGADRTRLRQFSVGLTSGKRNVGSLRMTFRDDATWLKSAVARPETTVVLLLPLVLAWVGGRMILKTLSPINRLAGQLEQVAATHQVSQIKLQPLPGRDALSLGWNRLAELWMENYAHGTLKERLEAAIAECEQNRCRDLLEGLPVGIAETDAEGNIEFMNQALQALFNLDQEGVRKVSLRDGILAELDPEATKVLFDPGAQDREVSAEIERPSSSGRRCLRISRHPLKTSHGQRQVWEVRDVTQAKLAERARDEFLDSATHEIRTPLANIKAYAETLTLTEMTDVEQQREFCNVINSEATRLSRFIDELLDISSIEAGSLAVNRQRVEVPRLLDEVVAKVRPQMTQKNITFDTVFGEKLPELMLDKDKFATCLVNLLGNAAKYTPEGGHVTFRARCEDDQLILEVVDTGIGIPPDELPRVFEKFYRGKDQRVHQEAGTGLGLAFTREVINLHHGTLTAESEPNQGSTFTITMPIA